MEYHRFLELQELYSSCQEELSYLDKLQDNAIKRWVDTEYEIANEFISDDECDITHEINKDVILHAFKNSSSHDVFRIVAAKEGVEHAFSAALLMLKRNKPEIFTQPGAIAIQVSVQADYDLVSELYNDINECKNWFSASEVKINAKFEKEQPGNKFLGGILIQYLTDNATESSTDEEIILNGRSSKDMANFIREVVKVYVSQHPGISLKQLQYDLNEIHNGHRWKFVEDRSIVEPLSEEGRILYSLAYYGTLDDGTEYVLYNNLYRSQHLPRAIEFAKRHGII